MIPLQQGYIHPWFRKGSVHLLCGTSGSGKSRLLFQFMEALEGKAPTWMDLPLAPEPFVYIASDRPLSLVKETWDQMGIVGWQKFKVVPALDEDINLFPNWIKRAGEVESHATIFLVEHWTSYIGGAKNDVGKVIQYMKTMVRWADVNKFTIIGVMEENKAKQNRDRYEDPRQRVSGVAEWGHLADTVMNIEKHDRADPGDPVRVLSVSDHNHCGTTIKMLFNTQGRLIR